MSLDQQISRGLAEAVRCRHGVEIPPPAASEPPDATLGDLAYTICFELARTLRQAPRQIATGLAEDLRSLAGVAAVEVAGAGYLNVFLDRRRLLLDLLAHPGAPPPATDQATDAGSGSGSGKVIVEHTNINPNKAAHIGHLRNAVLGDTLVRTLRYLGHDVEVQNYIDDTGVQVADLVVGFTDLDGPSADEAAAGSGRFDDHCWDLYARVTALYKEQPELKRRREEVLHLMEAGDNPTAAMAARLVDRIVRAHLATMARLGVVYDLLPRESDILHLHFWARAFELLKERGAVQLESEGKNAGCWVMDLSTDAEFADIEDNQKVLVRSNGTVTYTGKDIAYQLWKFGLLGLDFGYRLFHTYPDGHQIWVTDSCGTAAADTAPSFGNGRLVYNVIDQRQAYPQKVVAKGLAALGHEDEAGRSRHFAYEMVALTPACAEEMGMPLEEADRQRPYVEMSGRRGLGVKADDLLDRLMARASDEVEKRNPDMPAAETRTIATLLANGALRYFMLRFTRNRVIAFDFNEVLSFEGETGPYVQYSVVRAANILRKLEESGGPGLAALPALAGDWLGESAPAPPAAEWDLPRACARLGTVVAEAVERQDLAGLARHAFTLAQTFNHFYHHFPVLVEEDQAARRRRILLVDLFRRTMLRTLDLMGVAVPARM